MKKSQFIAEKKLRLIILTNTLEGGAGRFTFRFSSLEKYYPNWKVYGLSLQKPIYKKKLPALLLINFFSISFYRDYYSLNLADIFLFIKEFLWLFKQINNLKPDAVISIDTHANFLICLVKLFYINRLVVICTNHINTTETVKKRLSFFLILVSKVLGHLLYTTASAVTGVSNGVSNDVQTFYNLNKKVITIYNGFTLNEQLRILVKKNPIRFITICRLVEQKDVKNLLDAFSLFEGENYELDIIGDGPLKKSLIQYSNLLNISKRVHFWGWKDNPLYFLKKSHIFVLSSKREGFPYVLLEAMSLYKPVISTDSPFGPRELIGNNKYGLLVKMNNHHQLYKAMNRLATNQKLYEYYAKKGFERVKYFSDESMFRKYMRLIESFL